MTPCPKCRRWIWKDWTLVCSFAPRRFIVTASRRSMPTIFAGRGTVGSPILQRESKSAQGFSVDHLHDVDLAIEEVRRVVS